MKNYNHLCDEDKQQIIALYYKKKSYVDIMDVLNVSERAVARTIKEAGINPRLKNRYRLNENFFEVIDTEEKAYILGYAYADGFVGDERINSIVFVITKNDEDLLRVIAEKIEYTGNLMPVKSFSGCYENSKSKVRLNFSSKKMASDLRNLGLYPNKSTTMFDVPKIDKNLMRHFIRGYFDGDGCISIQKREYVHRQKNGKQSVYTYNMCTLNMIGTIQFLDKLKPFLPVEFADGNCKAENMKYIKTSSKKSIRKIYDCFYKDSTIYLQRKHDKFLKLLGPTGK